MTRRGRGKGATAVACGAGIRIVMYLVLLNLLAPYAAAQCRGVWTDWKPVLATEPSGSQWRWKARPPSRDGSIGVIIHLRGFPRFAETRLLVDISQRRCSAVPCPRTYPPADCHAAWHGAAKKVISIVADGNGEGMMSLDEAAWVDNIRPGWRQAPEDSFYKSLHSRCKNDSTGDCGSYRLRNPSYDRLNPEGWFGWSEKIRRDSGQGR